LKFSKHIFRALFQEGIETVNAAYEVFVREGLEDFQPFAFELQTVAKQKLTPEHSCKNI